MADFTRGPDFLGPPQRPQDRQILLYRADVPPNNPSIVFPPGVQSFPVPQRYSWISDNAPRNVPKELLPDDTISVQNVYEQESPIRWPGNVQDTSRSTPLTLFPLVSAPLPPGQASFVAAPFPPFTVVNTSMRSFPTTQPPPPLQSPSTGNFHSWYTGKIGIRTRISQNSQVDSDTGDTGGT